MDYEPKYLKTDLKVKSEELLKMLKNCPLCARNCHVNRLQDELGYCRTGRWSKISSYGPHFGKEPELVGNDGSGTINSVMVRLLSQMNQPTLCCLYRR